MRFFSLPHILWHWASVYNGHIRWHVALTPVAERFKLSLPIFTIGLSGLDANTQPFACEVYALTNWATAAVRLLICVVICYIMARSKVFDHGSSAKVIDERVSIKENSRNCPMTTRQRCSMCFLKLNYHHNWNSYQKPNLCFDICLAAFKNVHSMFTIRGRSY